MFDTSGRRHLDGFDRRFFILRDMKLEWWTNLFDEANGIDCKGLLDLSTHPVTIEVAGGDKSNMFALRPFGDDGWSNAKWAAQDRTFVFDVTDSDYDREEWLDTIFAHAAHAESSRRALRAWPHDWFQGFYYECDFACPARIEADIP